MSIGKLTHWLMTAEGLEPSVPKWLLPDCIYCDETQDMVWAALKEARGIVAKRKELLGLMPRQAQKIIKEADDTVAEIASKLAEKLEITP